ncbi:hypothetical protein D3C81_1486440 [compost metagenome]
MLLIYLAMRCLMIQETVLPGNWSFGQHRSPFAIPYILQLRALNSNPAIFGHKQPNLMSPYWMLKCMAVKRLSYIPLRNTILKILTRSTNPAQMLIHQKISPILQLKGFQQLKIRISFAQQQSLGQNFGIFILRS